MRDAKEFYEYCNENLTVQNGEKLMMTRKFFYIESECLHELRSIINEVEYNAVKDLMKIHQATTSENKEEVNRVIFICLFLSLCCYNLKHSTKEHSTKALKLILKNRYESYIQILLSYVN